MSAIEKQNLEGLEWDAFVEGIEVGCTMCIWLAEVICCIYQLAH